MQRINNDVVSFQVKVRGNWICYVTDLPVPDYTADTIEQSERSETYLGESEEYTVEVHRNNAETSVQVFDKNGNEVDFEISDIVDVE